jgi:hypothetical protein
MSLDCEYVNPIYSILNLSPGILYDENFSPS